MSEPGPGVTATIPSVERPASSARWRDLMSVQIAGPLLALLVAIVIFSLTTDRFFTAANFSLMLQQSVVIGTLAIGQTLIILTAGIDLANASIMVLGTVMIAEVAASVDPLLGLGVGVLVCAGAGALNGWIVSRWKLPPFIVTLGMLTILTATARLLTNAQSVSIERGLLTALGQGTTIGGFTITWGVVLWLVLTATMAYALTRTRWGTHVYAVGDAPNAARLNGVKVNRVLFSVYVVAGLVYALAAWQTLGRTPIADPSAYQMGNLDSITAVVIGGTSLFGGRGGVIGTLIGTLIVVVLQNGLTQAGIDSLYQQIATGALVIVAVLVDQFVRRKER